MVHHEAGPHEAIGGQVHVLDGEPGAVRRHKGRAHAGEVGGVLALGVILAVHQNQIAAADRHIGHLAGGVDRCEAGAHYGVGQGDVVHVRRGPVGLVGHLSVNDVDADIDVALVLGTAGNRVQRGIGGSGHIPSVFQGDHRILSRLRGGSAVGLAAGEGGQAQKHSQRQDRGEYTGCVFHAWDLLFDNNGRLSSPAIRYFDYIGFPGASQGTGRP